MRQRERERKVGFLVNRGRCHRGANAPTGVCPADHLTRRTAPSKVCAVLGTLRAPTNSGTKHVHRPGEHTHTKGTCDLIVTALAVAPRPSRVYRRVLQSPGYSPDCACRIYTDPVTTHSVGWYSRAVQRKCPPLASPSRTWEFKT